MYRLCLISLIVILTACVSLPTPVTPTSNIETITLVPATKTSIPTNTIVPIPSKDANIPEGYIKDVSGQYTKKVTTNGETFTFMWAVEKNQEGKLLFQGGVVEKAEGKGVGIGYYTKGYGSSEFDEYGRIQLFASENATGAASIPQFHHHEVVVNQFNEIDIAGITSGQLWKRIYPDVRYDNTVLPDFMFKVMAGDIPFPFETSSGAVENWFISPDNGAKVYIVDFESISSDFEFTDVSPVKIKLRMEIKGVNNNGELIILIATNQPWSSLTRLQYMEVLFAGSAHVVSQKESNGKSIGGLSEALLDWLTWADKVSPSTGEKWLTLNPEPVR